MYTQTALPAALVYTYIDMYIITCILTHICNSTQVLGHWSTSAPELKLLPGKLLPMVQDICATSVITPAQHCKILTHSLCLAKLIQHDKYQPQVLGLNAQNITLSDNLTALLRVICVKAKAGLSGKSKVTTKPWKSPYQPFEEMVCTATYGPAHPVTQCLPFFKYDYQNKQQVVRYAINKNKELEELNQELKDQSQRMGGTCKKYKTRQTVLSSGIFTMLCNRCGIIEYFELMCKPESPAVPARALFHRTWRGADLTAMDSYF